MSEQVQTRLRTYEKLAKTLRKLRERRVRAVVAFRGGGLAPPLALADKGRGSGGDLKETFNMVQQVL